MGNSNIIKCKSANNKSNNNRGTSINKNETATKITPTNLLIRNYTTNPELNYLLLNFIISESKQSIWKVKHKQIGLLRALIRRNKIQGEDVNSAKDAYNLIKTFDHPSIIKIFEIYDTNTHYDIITELSDGRSLRDEINDIGPLPEKVAANLIYQLLVVVNYMHNTKQIVHCCINPSNIHINSYSDENEYYDIKLMHFYSCIPLFEDNINTHVNEYRPIIKEIIHHVKNKSTYSNFDKCFFAPELIVMGSSNKTKYSYNSIISDKIDMWSIGLIAFYILTGKIPYNLTSLSQSDLSNPIFDRISQHGKSLIAQLLSVNLRNRISAKTALKSKWFTFLETKNSLTRINKLQSKKILNNINKFKSNNVLYDKSIEYLVHNVPDIEDVRYINKMFLSFNSGCNGHLTKEDIKEGFVIGNQEENKKGLVKTVDEWYDLIDINGNGYIEYEEFVRAGIDKKLFVEKEVLRFSFNFFDKDKDGKISFKDLNDFLTGSTIDKEEQFRQIKRDISLAEEEFIKIDNENNELNDLEKKIKTEDRRHSTIFTNIAIPITFESYEIMMKKFLCV